MEKGFTELSACSVVKHEKGHTPGAQDVACRLSRLLVFTRALCHKSMYCHWQVMHPELTGMHSMFEQQYQSLRKAVDFIGDRIHALGFELPSQFSEPAWETCKHETHRAEEMISSLIRNHVACAQEAKAVLVAADDAGDNITAHLAVQRLSSHEKASWVLAALLSGKNFTHSVM